MYSNAWEAQLETFERAMIVSILVVGFAQPLLQT